MWAIEAISTGKSGLTTSQTLQNRAGLSPGDGRKCDLDSTQPAGSIATTELFLAKTFTPFRWSFG